ncbi:MAG: c-type cytochrome [Pseudobdellovibrio sp.]
MKKQIIVIKIIVLSSLMMLFYQNCSNNMAPMNLDSPSLASLSADQVQVEAMSILSSKCAACHNASAAAGDIGYITDLNSLEYYRLVVPGEPMLSPLYSVLSTDDQHTSILTQDESNLLYRWINETLVNNPAGITPPTTTALTATYASIAQNILTPRCNSCHGATAGTTGGGKNFSNYANLMASGQVTAGNAANSTLYQSITRTTDQMPKGGVPLTSQEMQIIMDWINAGAMNN